MEGRCPRFTRLEKGHSLLYEMGEKNAHRSIVTTGSESYGRASGCTRYWECMQQLFPDGRERRVAYLVFHCNLSPQDIFCFAPQGFRDVQEIRHLRLHMLERILLHSDLILQSLPVA